MSSRLIAASSSQRDGSGVPTRNYARTPSSRAVSRPAGEAGFVLMDSQGKVIHANKQACRILTYPQEIGNDFSGRASILAQLNSTVVPFKALVKALAPAILCSGGKWNQQRHRSTQQGHSDLLSYYSGHLVLF